MQNTFIISFRRSGTHLTYDALINNWEFKQELLVLDQRLLQAKYKQDFTLLKEEMESNKLSTLIKTHVFPELGMYSPDTMTLTQLKEIFNNSAKIYVYRDGKDVMVSLYKYMQTFNEDVQAMKFSEFIRSQQTLEPMQTQMSYVEMWANHLRKWSDEPYGHMLKVKFADIRYNYDSTLERVSEYLQLEPKQKYVDIRRSGDQQPASEVTHTHVKFRKGISGDHQNFFTAEDVEYFNQTAKSILGESAAEFDLDLGI